MSVDQNLLPLLACPLTGEPLSQEGSGLRSTGGEHEYPLINGIPWLLPRAQNSLMDWTAKLHHFNRVILAEIKALETELGPCAPVYSPALKAFARR